MPALACAKGPASPHMHHQLQWGTRASLEGLGSNLYCLGMTSGQGGTQGRQPRAFQSIATAHCPPGPAGAGIGQQVHTHLTAGPLDLLLPLQGMWMLQPQVLFVWYPANWHRRSQCGAAMSGAAGSFMPPCLKLVFCSSFFFAFI